MVVELLDGRLGELGAPLLGCLYNEVHREATLRALLDESGQARGAASLAGLIHPNPWAPAAIHEAPPEAAAP